MTGTLTEDDQLREQETAKRMEAVLKRALSTPQKAHKPPAKAEELPS
jgi:hypothetical protein